MSKSEMYVHGTLEKFDGTGRLERTIWGPSEYMVVGKVVKVEENDGSWTQDWVVRSVYGEPMPEKLVAHRSRDYLRQRAASDI